MSAGPGPTAAEVSVWVSETPLQLEQAERVAGESDGALVVFSGVVRDNSDGRSVVALVYEAYQPMAEQEMKKIAVSARERYRVGRIAIGHRVGHLAVGEVSVIVAVSAPHRDQAFEACRYCIDTLKRSVPIWKKELFSDGSSRWVSSP